MRAMLGWRDACNEIIENAEFQYPEASWSRRPSGELIQ